jgi:hypothetical protein
MTATQAMPFAAITEMINASPSVLAALPAGHGALQVAHALYDFSVDGGAISTIVPALTAQIPDNAIIVGGVVNPTTAPTGTAGATVAVGVTAGGTSTELLAATVIASLTLDALLAVVPTLAAPVKQTASGNIEVTIAVHALTGGVIEIFVFYVTANN